MLPCIVYVGDRLAARLNAGFRLDVQAPDIAPDVLEELKLQQHQLDEIFQNLPAALEEVESLLG